MKFRSASTLVILYSYFFRLFPVMFTTSDHPCSDELCSHVRMSFSSSMASAMTCMKVLHEVTACIYKQGDEKPAMKWSFLTKKKECDLSSFLRYLKSCGFDDRAKEIGVSKYKTNLQYKRLTTEPEFPRGRIFAIDTVEQFKVALPLLQDKHEHIGKF